MPPPPRPGSSAAFEAQELINQATAPLEARLMGAIEESRTEFKSDIRELREGQETIEKTLSELVKQEATRTAVAAALEKDEQQRRERSEWSWKKVGAIVAMATTAAGGASWIVQHFAR